MMYKCIKCDAIGFRHTNYCALCEGPVIGIEITIDDYMTQQLENNSSGDCSPPEMESYDHLYLDNDNTISTPNDMEINMTTQHTTDINTDINLNSEVEVIVKKSKKSAQETKGDGYEKMTKVQLIEALRVGAQKMNEKHNEIYNLEKEVTVAAKKYSELLKEVAALRSSKKEVPVNNKKTDIKGNIKTKKEVEMTEKQNQDMGVRFLEFVKFPSAVSEETLSAFTVEAHGDHTKVHITKEWFIKNYEKANRFMKALAQHCAVSKVSIKGKSVQLKTRWVTENGTRKLVVLY